MSASGSQTTTPEASVLGGGSAAADAARGRSSSSASRPGPSPGPGEALTPADVVDLDAAAIGASIRSPPGRAAVPDVVDLEGDDCGGWGAMGARGGPPPTPAAPELGSVEAADAARGRSSSSASRPGPSPGPGEAVTPSKLRERWKKTAPPGDHGVLGFYGHSRGDYMCFSNFYDQKSQPFAFQVPASFLRGLPRGMPDVVPCSFSEKAIMLCKAAVMGDAETYEQIALATDPRKAKALGRKVQNFRASLWEEVVCSVAFEVVHQKFSKTPSLQGKLLKTGGRLIAEATSNDANWGIGIDTGDPRVQRPAEWEGSNILGWALMEAREALRQSCSAAAPAREAAAQVVDLEGGDCSRRAAAKASGERGPGNKRRWQTTK